MGVGVVKTPMGMVRTQEGVAKTQVGEVKTQLPPARFACTKSPICKSSTGSAAYVQPTTADSFYNLLGSIQAEVMSLASEKYPGEAAQVCQVHIEKFRLQSSNMQQ